MDKLFLMEGPNSNRQEWEFEYTAGAIAEAARKQKDFRESRVRTWTDKKSEVMKKIREAGIDIETSLADEMLVSSNYHTRSQLNDGPKIVVDQLLQKHLTEAHMKVKEHEELVKKYDAWIQVLEANREARLKLKHADWMFFFGK